MSRKPHSNAVLKNLPQEKRKEIYERFAQTDWREMLAQLKTEGIDVGKTALYEFRAWYEDLKPILEANDFAKRFADALAADKSLAMDPAQINRVAQSVFEMQAIQRQDAGLFQALQRLRVSQEANEIRRESQAQKLREYEDKMAQAKAALQGVDRGGISKETLAQIEEAVRIL